MDIQDEVWRVGGYHGAHDEAGAFIVDQDGRQVCSTSGGLRDGSTPQEWQAYYRRARLIAASPRLFEVLKSALSVGYTDCGWQEEAEALINAVEADHA